MIETQMGAVAKPTRGSTGAGLRFGEDRHGDHDLLARIARIGVPTKG